MSHSFASCVEELPQRFQWKTWCSMLVFGTGSAYSTLSCNWARR